MLLVSLPSLATVDQKFPGFAALFVLALCAWRILWSIRERFRGPPVDGGGNIFDASLPEIGERVRNKLERMICSGKAYLVPVIVLPCFVIGVLILMPLFEAQGLRRQDGFSVSLLVAAIAIAWIGWDDGAVIRVPDATDGGTKADILRHVFLGLSMPKWAMVLAAVGLVSLHGAREAVPTLPPPQQVTPQK